MALRPVDKLLAGYLALVSMVILTRGDIGSLSNLGMLAAHALFGVLLYLFTKLDDETSVGNTIHDLYPLLLVLPLYAEFGLLNDQIGLDRILTNDRQIQSVEALIFGGQISYTLIRDYPSALLSWILHLAYLAYYPMVLIGPLWLTLRREPDSARNVLFATLIAYVFCYVFFVLYPVAGPNYAFDHPTGPVREVLPARIVYAALARGSSVGAAFPSSHVAATVAATLALWINWKPLGKQLTVPCILLILGTVYCQMHYAVDTSAGLATGIGAAWLGKKFDS